ncbi:MAG: hypothetical protein ACFFDT_40335 [Candidatus Hodarchaeota archaeon]
MVNKNDIVINQNKTKTFRWLFYISLFQLFACFILPVILFPVKVMITIELFIALTVGLLFGLYLLGVNIYGIFVDRRRRTVYIVITIFIGAWAIWTIITWVYIEYMYYLT